MTWPFVKNAMISIYATCQLWQNSSATSLSLTSDIVTIVRNIKINLTTHAPY